jgi:hypothetical protein
MRDVKTGGEADFERAEERTYIRRGYKAYEYCIVKRTARLTAILQYLANQRFTVLVLEYRTIGTFDHPRLGIYFRHSFDTMSWCVYLHAMSLTHARARSRFLTRSSLSSSSRSTLTPHPQAASPLAAA